MRANIFQDPITRKNFEGEAELITKIDLYTDPGFEYWIVQFHGPEESPVQRLISIKDKVWTADEILKREG